MHRMLVKLKLRVAQGENRYWTRKTWLRMVSQHSHGLFHYEFPIVHFFSSIFPAVQCFIHTGFFKGCKGGLNPIFRDPPTPSFCEKMEMKKGQIINQRVLGLTSGPSSSQSLCARKLGPRDHSPEKNSDRRKKFPAKCQCNSPFVCWH